VSECFNKLIISSKSLDIEADIEGFTVGLNTNWSVRGAGGVEGS
jgi:hypothetical protein